MYSHMISVRERQNIAENTLKCINNNNNNTTQRLVSRRNMPGDITRASHQIMYKCKQTKFLLNPTLHMQYQ